MGALTTMGAWHRSPSTGAWHQRSIDGAWHQASTSYIVEGSDRAIIDAALVDYRIVVAQSLVPRGEERRVVPMVEERYSTPRNTCSSSGAWHQEQRRVPMVDDRHLSPNAADISRPLVGLVAMSRRGARHQLKSHGARHLVVCERAWHQRAPSGPTVIKRRSHGTRD